VTIISVDQGASQLIVSLESAIGLIKIPGVCCGKRGQARVTGQAPTVLHLERH